MVGVCFAWPAADAVALGCVKPVLEGFIPVELDFSVTAVDSFCIVDVAGIVGNFFVEFDAA